MDWANLEQSDARKVRHSMGNIYFQIFQNLCEE
jgi:hypothetical protein